MDKYLKHDFLVEDNITIGDIPVIRLYPKNHDDLLPTIIFYHGWSSNKESQRLRGFILGSLGFQVLIPDAIYHGERNPLDNYEPENATKYFWYVVLNNIKESNKIIDYSISNLKADPHRIGVSGHSMGGFTSSGIFTHNPNIKAVVTLNGSSYWKNSNYIFKSALGMDLQGETAEEEEYINSMDPMNNLELLKNRPILLLHGAADKVVDIDSDRKFYMEIKNLYSDKTKVQLIEYNNLGHFVTTNMMEDMAIWFKKYL